MPMRVVRLWFMREAKLLAFVYLLVVPAVIVALSIIASYNLAKNRAQDKRQAAAIAANRMLIAANCERSDSLLSFIGSIVYASNSQSARGLQGLFSTLVADYNRIGDCPPFHR
jgi:hypothetical protein